MLSNVKPCLFLFKGNPHRQYFVGNKVEQIGSAKSEHPNNK